MNIVSTIPARLNRKYLLELCLLSILVAISFIFYFLTLIRHPPIYGIDGPYYLTQVRSILRTGTLKYGDPPLAFYLLTISTILCRDITLGVKIGVSILCSMIAIPVYILMKRITGSIVASTSSAIVAVFSYNLLRMASDLMKNAIGVLFLFISVYFIYNTLKGKALKSNIIGASIAILLTAATHILDFGVILLILMLTGIYSILFNVNRKEMLKLTDFILAIVIIFSSLALAMYTSFFTDFGKGLAFIRDLTAAFGDEVHVGFNIPLLNSLIVSYVFSLIGFLTAYYEYRRGNRIATVLMASNATLLILLALPIIPHQWLWRFNLMTFIPISIIAGYTVSLTHGESVRAIVAIAILAFFIQQAVSLSMTLKPTITMVEYYDLQEMSKVTPSNPLLIARFPLAYWVEYMLDGDLVKPAPKRGSQIVYGYLIEYNDKLPPHPEHTLLYRGKSLSLIKMPIRM